MAGPGYAIARCYRRCPGIAKKLLSLPRWRPSEECPTVMFSDATPWSLAAYSTNTNTSMLWRLQAPMKINEAEVVAGLLALRWEYENVQLGVDNTSALYAIATGTRHVHIFVANLLRNSTWDKRWVSDTRREKAPLEENGGGGKPFNNRPLRDQEPSSDGSWRGKGQVKQASPAETQVFQSSPRGRGRGIRGGRSMTTAEFVPTSSRTLPAKSVSETRTTPPQIEGDMDNYPIPRVLYGIVHPISPCSHLHKGIPRVLYGIVHSILLVLICTDPKSALRH
uniref:Uncharacterized protein n=1 Tax=Timema shepardi TaxID=629360 RepID=A0A7R9B2H5_TIMSH|nr:unnamed protein product [Timema shepardi]